MFDDTDQDSQPGSPPAGTEQQQLWQTLFETSVSPTWIGTPDGGFLRANEATCEMLGYPREELEQMHYRDVLHPEQYEQTDDDVAAAVSGERRSYRRERRLVRADGDSVWADIAVTLLRHPDGTPRYWIVQGQDTTERHHYEQRLEHMANHDPLTGLLNRRGFESELRRHFLVRRQHGAATGALLMVDLDNFKAFNDTHGHAAGDTLITKVAIGLQRHVRADDVVGRIGGDEFAILLPSANAPQAQLVADALRGYMRGDLLPAVQTGEGGTEMDPPEHRITASIGVYSLAQEDGVALDEAMGRADQAMYDAKRRGRDSVVVYNVSNR